MRPAGYRQCLCNSRNGAVFPKLEYVGQYPHPSNERLLIPFPFPFPSHADIDSSRDRLFFDLNFSDPQFVYLAQQIGAPGRIRFGGTGNDALTYQLGAAPSCRATDPGKYECLNQTWWDSLTALSAATGAPLIFGLNIHPADSGESPPKAAWNGTNARDALAFAKAQGAPVFGLELGNEQNTIMTAAEQAAAFRVLAGVVDEVFGSSSPSRPLLFGPDPHSFKDAGSALPATVKYISEFVAATEGILSFATHHEYIEIDYTNILDPNFLDLTSTIARAVMTGVRNASATVGVVAGEIGPHNGGTYGPSGVTPNCAGNRVCGRFGSALWYADSMSAKAAAGYAAYCRQDIIGADCKFRCEPPRAQKPNPKSLPKTPSMQTGSSTPRPWRLARTTGCWCCGSAS